MCAHTDLNELDGVVKPDAKTCAVRHEVGWQLLPGDRQLQPPASSYAVFVLPLPLSPFPRPSSFPFYPTNNHAQSLTPQTNRGHEVLVVVADSALDFMKTAAARHTSNTTADGLRYVTVNLSFQEFERPKPLKLGEVPKPSRFASE